MRLFDEQGIRVDLKNVGLHEPCIKWLRHDEYAPVKDGTSRKQLAPSMLASSLKRFSKMMPGP